MLAALALALTLGCTPGTVVLEEVGESGDGIFDLAITPSEVIPSVVEVSWSTDAPCEGRVELGLDGDYARWMPATSEDGTRHHAVVMGLKAGRDYALRPVASCEDGAIRGDETWLSVPEAPRGLPRIDIKLELGHERLQPGYFLAAEMEPSGSWIAILDRDWDYVWWWDAGHVNAFTAYPARDGSGVLYAQNSQDQSEDIGATVYVPWDGRAPRTTCNAMGHHVSVELPDDAIGFLAVDLRTMEVDGATGLVAGDAIVEAPLHSEDCEDEVEVFSFFDAYSPEEDRGEEFDHLTVAGGADWTHANSLMYSESDDAYHVMARNLDAIVKVDRASGEVLWQMGGADSDFTFGAPCEAWNHGHMSHLWDDGLLVFDNGTDREPQHTRVAEYTYDADALTVRLVWEHWHPDGAHVPFAGDARRLPGGNVVVSWGSMGRLTEFDGDEVLMDGEMPLGAVLGRVEWLANLGDLPLSPVD